MKSPSDAVKPEIEVDDYPATVPVNLRAERAVLGAVIEDDSLIADVLGVGLSPSDFLLADHQRTFTAIVALKKKGAPVDIVSVLEELGNRDRDAALLSDLITGVVIHRGHILYHAGIVQQKSKLRALQKLGEWILNSVNACSEPGALVGQICERLKECR
jgi:replicative DNA helicase